MGSCVKTGANIEDQNLNVPCGWQSSITGSTPTTSEGVPWQGPGTRTWRQVLSTSTLMWKLGTISTLLPDGLSLPPAVGNCYKCLSLSLSLYFWIFYQIRYYLYKTKVVSKILPKKAPGRGVHNCHHLSSFRKSRSPVLCSHSVCSAREHMPAAARHPSLSSVTL